MFFEFKFICSVSVDEIDGYLYYFGGTAGVLTLTGIAAASAYYFASRPIPEKPLVPLENQSPILEVSKKIDPLIAHTLMNFCKKSEILITNNILVDHLENHLNIIEELT